MKALRKSSTLLVGILAASVVAVLYVFVIQKNISNANEGANETQKIVASIAPLQFIVEYISGESIPVSTIVDAGESPEIYTLSARELRELEQADLFFCLLCEEVGVGFPFEMDAIEQFRNSSKKNAMVVELGAGIPLLPLEETVFAANRGDYTTIRHDLGNGFGMGHDNSDEVYNMHDDTGMHSSDMDIYIDIEEEEVLPYGEGDIPMFCTFDEQSEVCPLDAIGLDGGVDVYIDDDDYDDDYDDDDDDYDDDDYDDDDYDDDDDDYDDDDDDFSLNHDHTHGVDVHVWLDVDALAIIAKNVRDALLISYPEMEESLEENYQNFLAELTATEQELDVLLSEASNKAILIDHPSLGYLARRYGFTQISLEWLGQERSVQDMSKIVSAIEERDIQYLFTQQPVSQGHIRSLEHTYELTHVSFNPLKRNVFDNLQEIALSLRKSF